MKVYDDISQHSLKHYVQHAVLWSDSTHNKIADDKSWNEEGNGSSRAGCSHAIPQGFDPFPTQDSEHHHESVPEVVEVPSWHTVLSKLVRCV